MSLWIERIGCCKIVIKTPKYKQVNSLREKGYKKMARIYQDNALSIGNTPLVKLNRVVGGHPKVYAKIEGRNPAYSVKCRIGASLIWDAENRGVLTAGMEIVEPTSGNTGIALACLSGEDCEAIEEKCRSCGFKEILEKPISFKKIESLLALY